MKKLAVIAIASLGLLGTEVAAQGFGNRQPGGPGAQQPDPNNPNPPPRRQRGDQPPAPAPQPGPQPQRPPPVVQQPGQPTQPPRQWGGRPRGEPPVIVQPAPQPPPRQWGGGRPRYEPPVVYQQPPIYRPAPPIYRDGPGYRPGPPVVVVPGPSYGPPPGWRHRRSFDWCRAKAERLHEFEWRMQQDGRVSRDEARIARALRSDLANSCGGGRWHPNRGWHYG